MNETTIRRPTFWNSAQGTHVGMVREINEDSIVSLPAVNVWAVADGMGGYEAGNVASHMIVTSLTEVKDKETLNEFIDEIEDKLINVNQHIVEYANFMLDGRTLGSTVAMLAIKGRVGICMWAGDSRLYRLRHNELIQLTQDHSQVEDLVMQGLLNREEAEGHPDSNIITRAVGISEEISIDINLFSAQLGDIFLLCSDGLYNMISKQEINHILDSQPIDKALAQLISKTLENGAKDNVSVVLIKGERVFINYASDTAVG